MSDPEVSVLVVSYQSRELLRACLHSVQATVLARTFEILVADNASTDGTEAMLAAEFPQVRLLLMGANLGFARASNRALLEARGRYLLLLNPDTVSLGGAIDTLARHLESHNKVGVVAPRLLNADLTDQGTARAFPTAAAFVFGRRSPFTRLLPANVWSRRYLIGRTRTGDEPFAVDWVSGACLMVRRDVLERVGGLDEAFFMYWEDADWCRRIKQAGYEVFCVPAARVVHHEGGSRKGWPARQVLIFHQSVYRYYRKHHANGPWNIMRPIVATALAARALAIIAANAVTGASGPAGRSGRA